MRDDYSRKPAFASYRDLVHSLSRLSPPCAIDGAARSSFDRVHSRLGRRGVEVRGTALLPGCPSRAVEGVRVFVARRASRGRCRFLTPQHRFGALRSCRRPVLLGTRGTTVWRFAARVSLSPGLYEAGVRALDLRHRLEGPRRGRNVLWVRVRRAR